MLTCFVECLVAFLSVIVGFQKEWTGNFLLILQKCD